MGESYFFSLEQPLDLSITLNSGQAFRWRRTPSQGWISVLGNDLVRLWPVQGGLLINNAPTRSDLFEGLLRSYFRLDDDLLGIQAKLAGDSHLRDAINDYPGLRLLRQDPWETLITFILSQNSNMARIATTIEKIAQSFGNLMESDGIHYRTFPNAETMAGISEESFRALGCGYRAPFLLNAANVVASGKVKLDTLRFASYEQAKEELLSIRGVGEKVADCVMLFSLDQMTAFPVDRWIHRALKDWYAADAIRTYSMAREWALKRFGAHAGYANQYLFWRRRERS